MSASMRCRGSTSQFPGVEATRVQLWRFMRLRDLSKRGAKSPCAVYLLSQPPPAAPAASSDRTYRGLRARRVRALRCRKAFARPRNPGVPHPARWTSSPWPTAPRSGITPAHRVRELETVHAARHQNVRKHHIDIAVSTIESRPACAPARLSDPVAQLLEIGAGDVGDFGIVLDHEHGAGRRRIVGRDGRRAWLRRHFPAARQKHSDGGAAPRRRGDGSRAAGLPRETVTWDSPSPVPLPTSLVVKNGSNTRGRASGGMPFRYRRCARRRIAAQTFLPRFAAHHDRLRARW